MDPFTIAMLASAGVGLAQAGVNAFSPNSAARANREALEKLKQARESGGFGLSSADQRAMYQNVYEPGRRYAEAQRQEYERVAGALGQTGSELAQLRREAGQRSGEAAQRAATEVSQADERERLRQRAEYDQRLAAQQAYRQDRNSAVFSGLSQAASAAGSIAGSPAEVLKRLAPEARAQMAWMKKNNPVGYQAFLDSLGQSIALKNPA
jgi:hypothetical protein